MPDETSRFTQAPHPVLKDYYADESGRKQRVRQLFDAAANHCQMRNDSLIQYCQPQKRPLMSPLENEVAELIIDNLNLEEVTVADIDAEAPLFREGLGLDSIDALELSLAISQRYGFQIKSDGENNQQIFSSLRALSRHIEDSRKL